MNFIRNMTRMGVLTACICSVVAMIPNQGNGNSSGEDSIYLLPLSNLSHDILFKEQGSEGYYIETTGYDPFAVFSLASSEYNSHSYAVLDFEYRSQTGIDELKIYYFDGLPSEENSIKVGSLGRRDEWTRYSSILSTLDMNGTWGACRHIRMDFGNSKDSEIQLRNLRLRKMNEGEKLMAESAMKALQDKRERLEPKMSFLDNGEVRLGVNLSIGGAITYVAQGDGPNIVNNADWGRQIQMSFYSGPIPFSTKDSAPSKQWQHLGWNPIQSGDVERNPAEVVDHSNDGRTLYTRTIPKQWPLNNVPGDCVFESWITLEGNTAKVRARLTNQRSDKTQYAGRSQELPAVYVNGPWHRLMTYCGDAPFTNDALSMMNSEKTPGEFPWNFWLATENWAALVNDENVGLGIWMPESTNFLGNFLGTPGVGGTQDQSTGYVSPLLKEILDHDIVYEYEYTLILGSLEEIRGFVYAHSDPELLPMWEFEDDRQHWSYKDARDTGWPIQGALNIEATGPHPVLIGPVDFWLSEDATKLRIRAAFETESKVGRIIFKRFSDMDAEDKQSFSKDCQVSFEIIGDGVMRDYLIELSDNMNYSGGIVQLALELPRSNNQTRPSKVRIESIRLHR